MKNLDNYPKLTIRISKVRISDVKHASDDGYGYRHFVDCDEIPECRISGSTVSDALEKFQIFTRLWTKLSK